MKGYLKLHLFIIKKAWIFLIIATLGIILTPFIYLIIGLTNKSSLNTVMSILLYVAIINQIGLICYSWSIINSINNSNINLFLMTSGISRKQMFSIKLLSYIIFSFFQGLLLGTLWAIVVAAFGLQSSYYSLSLFIAFTLISILAALIIFGGLNFLNYLFTNQKVIRSLWFIPFIFIYLIYIITLITSLILNVSSGGSNLDSFSKKIYLEKNFQNSYTLEINDSLSQSKFLKELSDLKQKQISKNIPIYFSLVNIFKNMSNSIAGEEFEDRYLEIVPNIKQLLEKAPAFNFSFYKTETNNKAQNNEASNLFFGSSLPQNWSKKNAKWVWKWNYNKKIWKSIIN